MVQPLMPDASMVPDTLMDPESAMREKFWDLIARSTSILPSRTLKERDSKKAPALSAVLTEANDNGPLSSKNAVSILKDPVLPLAEADPSSEPALEN